MGATRLVRRRWKGLLAAFVGLTGIVLAAGCGTLRAKGILEDTLDPPADLAARVDESTERFAVRGETVSIHVARPKGADGPLPAFVLCHGAAAGGALDRRLLSLARAIAARGATVAVPDLPSLRTFRMDRDDPSRLADVALWLADRDDWTEDGRVAFLGICVGGSYSLLAADAPKLEGRVSAVMTFGAYGDLEALLFRWVTEPAQHKDLFDPLTEGRRRVLLGNLDELTTEQDRPHLRRALEALLDGRPVPAAPPGLTAGGREIQRIAASSEPLSAPQAETLLGPLRGTLKSLSPSAGGLPEGLDCFVLHARADPVVPVSDADILEQVLEAAGNDVDVHVTELFDHVDANASPGLIEALSLLRFFADFLGEAGL